jgi:tetratricopeptide (TPR) repeat protein
MRASALAHQGKKQEAMPDYEKALGIAARAHSDEGTAQTIQSIADSIGVDQAIQRLEEQAKGGEDRWRITMVELYLRKGDTARASSKADQLVADADAGKLNSKGPDGRDRDDRPNAYGVAGMTYMTTGQYDKAASTYDKLLKIVPEDTVALNNLACIWVDFHQPTDPAKALTYSTKAIEITQKAGISAPDLLDTHGWALTCSGRVDEGIGFLQRALERRQMLDARYHLGMALLKKNLGPEAQVQLAQAQKLIEERKHKGQPVDKKLEDGVAEAMTKAKALANGSSAGT